MIIHEHLLLTPRIIYMIKDESPTASDFRAPSRIGEWSPIPAPRFSRTKEIIVSFTDKDFQCLSERKKFKMVNKTLLQLIQEQASPCFLMPAVFHYIHEVNQASILKEPYSFSLFEFWLNHFSKLSPEENLEVRGKIVGRYIPRDEYQSFFPIGMNRYFPGSHFVAAHLSPDVDTTVASLIGWIDAFGCRVSEGIHQWSLPYGFSDGYITALLDSMFFSGFLTMAPRHTPACTLAAMDLVTKKNFHKVSAHTRGDSIEHGGDEHAYIIVADDGTYRGEWRSHDAESVRLIVTAFSNCIRWFENALQRAYIHALAEEKASLEKIEDALNSIFSTIIKDSEPVLELSDRSKKVLGDYVRKILALPDGMNSSYLDLIQAVDRLFSLRIEEEIRGFIRSIASKMGEAQRGELAAYRLHALELLETLILNLSKELDHLRESVEVLDHLLSIKERVLNVPNECVFLNSSVEEMRNKAEHTAYLTVLVPESNGASFPVGVVWTNDLKKSTLGTASLRDFSNLEETKMASYIDVISVIDHHKTSIKTSASSTLILGDAQSCNTLIAELSLSLNNRWSAQALSLDPWIQRLMSESKEIEGAVLETLKEGKKGSAASPYFVDPTREIYEYILYILAILDDTDLLSKVSRRDVLCLERLLNRAASLVRKAPTRVISFDDIPQDSSFTKQAAKRLLQNEELHSIYKNVYRFRESDVEKTLIRTAEGEPSAFFADTKEQNGCCRIGQTKLFERNIETFHKVRSRLIARWLADAANKHSANPHLDFFLHMISTVPGEREVYSGSDIGWSHSDEIWLWTPSEGVAEQHLGSFLSLFQNSPTGQSLPMDVYIEGKSTDARHEMVQQHFPKAKSIHLEQAPHEAVIVLRFPAGQINSRKSQISPFLPKLVP